VQLAIQATGREILIPAPEVCERTARQFEGSQALASDFEWNAYLKIADRLDPSYRN
jgi:hypothetical protein